MIENTEKISSMKISESEITTEKLQVQLPEQVVQNGVDHVVENGVENGIDDVVGT